MNNSIENLDNFTICLGEYDNDKLYRETGNDEICREILNYTCFFLFLLKVASFCFI